MTGEDSKQTRASREAPPAPEPALEPAPKSTPEPTPEPDRPPPQSTGSAPPAPPRTGSAAIAWLALLLVLALAAGGVWALLEAQQRESELRQRLQGVEVGTGRDLSAIDQISNNLMRQIELEVAAAQTTLRGEWQDRIEQLRQRTREMARQAEDARQLQQDVSRQVATLQEELAAARQTLEQQLKRFDSELARQRARLDQFGADDRDSWQLAEAQYLLRLANQRLVMTGDTDAAEALMRSADGILRELDDAGLLDVRRALAADLAAVRAVPRLDLEGAYLRLDALIEQAANLVLFELPALPEEGAPAEAEDWRDRLRLGYEKALEKLSRYVVFRRRDVPVESLMDPQWEGMVRQNLRMLLEQAQAGMLSGNRDLFRESLERARGWISQFFDGDEQVARAMARELEDLAGTRVSVDIPDASRTLQAMQLAMAARNREGGSAQ